MIRGGELRISVNGSARNFESKMEKGDEWSAVRGPLEGTMGEDLSAYMFLMSRRVWRILVVEDGMRPSPQSENPRFQ